MLAKIPPGVSAGEVNIVNQAINLTNNWLVSASLIPNALYLYLLALVGKLSNFNILYLRFFQAIIGFFTVFAFYEFTRNWFNRQTALIGALLFSASAFHVALSRQITASIFFPLIFITLFYLITNAFRTNKKIWFILGGIVFGLSLYVSPIFFIIPIFFALSSVYFYFKNKKIISGYVYGILSGAIAFALTAIPFFYYLPGNFTRIISAFNPGSIGKFYLNMGNLIQSLFYISPVNYLHNVGTEPLLDPFITVTFIAGFTYAVFHLKRKKFFFLVGWFVALLVILSLQPVQDFSTLIILLPAIYVLSAVMMDYVLTSWVRTFPFNVVARVIMTFVFSLFLFMSIFYNYQKYFYAFANNSETKELYRYQIEYNK